MIDAPVQVEEPGYNRIAFPVCLLIGWAAIAFGIQQLMTSRVDGVQWSVWFVGAILAHDMIVAPAVFAVGAGLRRIVPGRLLAAVQGGLIASGMLLLFAIPGLSGLGDRHGDSSRLPNDYPHGVAIVLIAVWAVTAVFLVSAWRRAPVRPAASR